MKVYVARPIRGRPYYMLTDHPTYLTKEVELSDEDAEKINQINLDFLFTQAYLAKAYHKYDAKLNDDDVLHAEGIE